MAKKRKQRPSELQAAVNPEPVQLPQPIEEDEPPKEEDPEVQEVEEEVEEVEEEDEEEVEEEEEEEDSAEQNGGQVNTAQTLGGTSVNGSNPNKLDDDSDDEPVEKLLEPFGKDQLIALVKKAVEKHPELIRTVRELSDSDPASRKIFVHGLSWDTTAETLTNEFCKYGEIEECKAVTDRVTGKSKGYAFILFKHRTAARRALQQPQKKIGNRTTSCQLASQGPVPAPPPTSPLVSEYTQRKIFVSNVSAEIDPNKLLEFFRQYGEIEEGPLGIDKNTGKPKGFALFVYKSVDSARKALEDPHKSFEGHMLNCQKAIDGPKQSKGGYAIAGGTHHQQYQQHQQGGNQLQSHYHHAKKGKYSTGAADAGHLMAPSGPSAMGYSPGVAAAGFNPGVAAGAPGLNPALGQALTALLATQGAGLGLGNILGGLGAPVSQGAPATGYGTQVAGGYANQMSVQGGYQNPQMGQGGPGRTQPGAPYMGHQ